jgi:hypothetical protein
LEEVFPAAAVECLFPIKGENNAFLIGILWICLDEFGEMGGFFYLSAWYEAELLG